MHTFILAICVAIFAIGPLVVWPSRWQVGAWMQLPFALVAVIVPIVFLDPFSNVSKASANLYFYISILSALTYILGIYIGFITKYRLPFLGSMRTPILNENYKKIIDRNVINIAVIAVIGFYISYAVMGFVPAFAADPFSAKFFRGQYQASYDRIAFLYRFSSVILASVLPILFVRIVERPSLKAILLAILATFAFIGSLVRGPMAAAASLVIGCIAARRGRIAFSAFIIIYGVIFCLGSALWLLFGFTQGTDDIAKDLVGGVPDISDQVGFLDSFLDHPEYTFGRTFIGGLIPYRFYWSPAVYTLRVLNFTDNVDDIASGGLRLHVGLWGYVSFGWIGAALLPFLSGFLNGTFIKFQKKLIQDSKSLFTIVSSVTLTYYVGVYINFYTTSLYQLLQAVAILYLYGVVVFSKKQKFDSFKSY